MRLVLAPPPPPFRGAPVAPAALKGKGGKGGRGKGLPPAVHGTRTFAAGALGSPGSVRFYNPELDVAYMKRATVSGNTAVANAGLRSGVMAHLSLADLILHGLDAPTAKQLVRTAAMPTVVADVVNAVAPQLEAGFAAAPSRAAAIGLVGHFDLGGFPGGAGAVFQRAEGMCRGNRPTVDAAAVANGGSYFGCPIFNWREVSAWEEDSANYR